MIGSISQTTCLTSIVSYFESFAAFGFYTPFALVFVLGSSVDTFIAFFVLFDHNICILRLA